MRPAKVDLSDFEDADTDFDYALPPRPQDPETAGNPGPRVLPSRRPVPASPPERTPVLPARRRGVGRPRSETTVSEPDRPRGSTLMVDASLMPLIHEAAERQGLSRGELIIQAIENAWEQLPDVLRPTPVGGSLFAPRPVAKRSSPQEGQVAMNYRLRGTEFDRLDELVDQVEAASRSHLINAALRIHLTGSATQSTTSDPQR